jgi:3-oxoacyl-[acyl-carrier-protein] synthase-3
LGARILGIEYHLPRRIETNDDLQRENPDWQVGKLYAKSGIRSRHVADPDETASDLGFEAARRLLTATGVAPADIGFLIYCTQSPDHFLPAAACTLQNHLGLPTSVGALDCNLGCSGYVYGLHLSKAFIDAGMARNVLLITADTYTKFIHPRDRTVRTLFGDGAAATLVGPSDDGADDIGPFILGTNGTGAANLIVPSGCFRLPRSAATAEEYTDDSGCTRSRNHLFMDGPAIFTFAITVVPQTVMAVLKAAGLVTEDVDWYIYHQANAFMLDNLAQRSKVPPEKMVIALEDVGNTVSASIPIALKRYVEAGKIKAGQRLMLIGFGVGYSWGACLVTWR